MTANSRPPAGEEWRYKVRSGRRLRRGFTSGTCAAAAAMAAVQSLFEQEPPARVQITVPAGITLELPLAEAEKGPGFAVCAIRKDAGDDPDITDGMLVYARAVPAAAPGMVLRAGPGIGRVTRSGLQVEIGAPAINPGPEQMIFEAVAAVLPAGRGVEVELYIPGGESLAEKTLNRKLGIVGGLSILGTSGIVEPLSEQSFQDCLALELKTVKAGGLDRVTLVTGNYGRELALKRFLLREAGVVKIGNLVGFSLDCCCELNFKRVLLVGHTGKLIKVAAGIFNTHNRVADARFEVFAARAALLGAGREVILDLQEAVTTEDMADILAGLGGPHYFDRLAGEISARARAYVHEEVGIGTVLFNFRRGLLGMDEAARTLLEEFKWKK